MGCACVDLNDDRLVDIYVTNDGMENFLFWNRGGGKFEEAGLLACVSFDGSGVPEASMGVDVGDYDRDGLLDLIVPCVRKQSFTLYRNQKTYFTDMSWPSGLSQITGNLTGFNPNFRDYDNDGDLDLFFTTGGVRTKELAPETATYTERYGYADLLLANDGKGRFHNVSKRAGTHFERELIGRGSAAGDLDNDGDIDLIISNLAGPACVLRNDTPKTNHWIALKLVGTKANLDALGTTVWCEAGGLKQRGAVHGGVTYLSQMDRRVHFGLGPATQVERLRVEWPSGEILELPGLAVDRIYTIVEGRGLVE
jgi:hypothetical protein